MTNKLTVEQCDRDAAVDLVTDDNLLNEPIRGYDRSAYLSGDNDESMLTQAFARHRQQAEARAAGLERALKEHHEWHMSFDLDDPEHGFNYATEYADSGMCERTLAALTAYRSARP